MQYSTVQETVLADTRTDKAAPISYRAEARVERLLEETLEAYHQYTDAGGPMVGDYAEFATQSLNCFQRALKNPDLSTEDLAWALRRCARLKRAAKQAGLSWASLTAAALSGRARYERLSDI